MPERDIEKYPVIKDENNETFNRPTIHKDRTEKSVNREKKMMANNEQTDYSEADVAKVLNQVNFHFWGEIVDWLKKHGAKENGLPQKTVDKMVADFSRLSNEGVEFTNDPEKAEKLAKESRNE